MKYTNKFKYFGSAGNAINSVKRQAIDWEAIFPNYISDKKHVSRVYKELLKFNNKKRKQFKKWTKDLNRLHQKYMRQKCVKMYSMFILAEMDNYCN